MPWWDGGDVRETQETPRGRLLPRGERRAQLIGAAAAAFARHGFAATGMEDVAREAGITKVLIYRHFESKTELYKAVLDDARSRLRAAVGASESFDPGTVRTLVLAAADDPDGFRLLFRHAQREPEFAAYAEDLRHQATETAEARLRDTLPDTRHRQWVAALIPSILTETILSWLDADRPVTADELADTIRMMQQALTATH